MNAVIDNFSSKSENLSLEFGGLLIWRAHNLGIYTPDNITCTTPEGFLEASKCYDVNSLYLTLDAGLVAGLGLKIKNVLRLKMLLCLKMHKPG